jgi:hypothetical protein
MAANVVNFALAPAYANNRGVLQFGTREADAVFRNNTRSLYTDATSRFNGQAVMLHGFLQLLRLRATQADFHPVFQVPADLNNPLDVNNLINFLDGYGQLELPHLRAFAITFVDAENRAAQDNFMATIAIMESLTEDAMNRISAWKQDYTVGPHNTISAVCLVKVLIRESRADSNFRVTVIRTNLSSLDEHFKEQGWSVTKLNTFIQGELMELRAYNETTNDLIPNLFKAYLSAPDEEFVRIIRDQRTLFFNGGAMTHDQLMTYAANQYKMMVEDKTWAAPSKDQVKLLALEAQLKKLNDKKGSNRAAGQGNNGKGNNRGDRPEWMSVKPTAEEIAAGYKKKVNDVEYKWCDHHQWSKHATHDCRAKDKPNKAPLANKSPTDHQNGHKILRALNAITTGDDESDNENEA